MKAYRRILWWFMSHSCQECHYFLSAFEASSGSKWPLRGLLVQSWIEHMYLLLTLSLVEFPCIVCSPELCVHEYHNHCLYMEWQKIVIDKHIVPIFSANVHAPSVFICKMQVQKLRIWRGQQEHYTKLRALRAWDSVWWTRSNTLKIVLIGCVYHFYLGRMWGSLCLEPTSVVPCFNCHCNIHNFNILLCISLRKGYGCIGIFFFFTVY